MQVHAQAILTDEYLEAMLRSKIYSSKKGSDLHPYFQEQLCTPMIARLERPAPSSRPVETSLDVASGFSS
jgi:hypothetical protein